MGHFSNYRICKSFIAGLALACFFLIPGQLLAQNEADSVAKDSIPVVHMPSGKGKGNDTTKVQQTTVRVKPEKPEEPKIVAKTDKEPKLKTGFDTTSIRLHNPKKAAWMSAALPGLGQIYNKKYWKIPVVYVGLGVCGYFAWTETVKYRKYKETYRYRLKVDLTATDWFPNETDNTIKEMKEYHHRNVEISYIAASLVYLLNIVDATVDAHLYGFDVSDDLSMQFVS